MCCNKQSATLSNKIVVTLIQIRWQAFYRLIIQSRKERSQTEEISLKFNCACAVLLISFNKHTQNS